MISRATSGARSSVISMATVPGMRAWREVEMISVWKQAATSTSPGMMHCTSTRNASTAPVISASSCCRKLPATGMPRRISPSLAVQQMPATLIPVAPSAFAWASSSGSPAASAMASASTGSCPCTTMFPWCGPGAADAGQDQAAVVVVHAHVGAVHDVHDLAVDAAGDDAEFAPGLLLLGRGAAEEHDRPFLPAELFPAGAGHVLRGLAPRRP